MSSLFDGSAHVSTLLRSLPYGTRFVHHGKTLTRFNWDSSGVTVRDESGKLFALPVNVRIPVYAVLD